MPNRENQDEIKEIVFYVLRGSQSDLSILDFSKYNSRILKMSDPAFKEIIDKHPSPEDPDHNWEIFQEIDDELKGTEPLYVLLPKNFRSQFSENDLLICFELILLLFPSDLSIFYKVCFQVLDENSFHYCGAMGYDFYSTGEKNYYENVTFIYDDCIKDINEFINLFKIRFKRIKYLQNALDFYLTSFRTATQAEAYLDLCICLESIIEGNFELSYRIKHHLALLCSDNIESAETIFKNLNKIYTLRSKIIHGETYKQSKINEYLPYLRYLVSRMIIEVVLLNVSDRTSLDNILTFAGFHKKPDLTRDYKKMTLNISSYVYSYAKELK